MNKIKRGSALLITIGAIFVLAIIVGAMIFASSNSSNITVFKTQQAKVEAVAESVNDYVLARFKADANIENTGEAPKKMFYFLRAPLQVQGDGSASQNAILEVGSLKDGIDVSSEYGVGDFANTVWSNMELPGAPEVKTEISMIHAEAFSAESGYKVAAVDAEHKPGKNLARFRDLDSPASTSDGNSNWQSSTWKLDMALPPGGGEGTGANGDNSWEENVEIGLPMDWKVLVSSFIKGGLEESPDAKTKILDKIEEIIISIAEDDPMKIVELANNQDPAFAESIFGDKKDEFVTLIKDFLKGGMDYVQAEIEKVFKDIADNVQNTIDAESSTEPSALLPDYDDYKVSLGVDMKIKANNLKLDMVFTPTMMDTNLPIPNGVDEIVNTIFAESMLGKFELPVSKIEQTVKNNLTLWEKLQIAWDDPSVIFSTMPSKIDITPFIKKFVSEALLEHGTSEFAIPDEKRQDFVIPEEGFDFKPVLQESGIFKSLGGELSADAFKTLVISGGEAPYSVAEYASKAANNFSQSSSGFSSVGSSFSPGGDLGAYSLEKGAICQIKTSVTLTEPSGAKKTTVLTSKIPVKVSDTQPIAPEYTFFIANSPALSDGGDAGVSLGGEVDLSGAIAAAGGVAGFKLVLHNLPTDAPSSSTDFKPSYTYARSKGLVPGMVRVNTSEESSLRAFLGTEDEINLSELPWMLARGHQNDSKANPVFNIIPSFYYMGGTAQVLGDGAPSYQKRRKHEIDLPVVFEHKPHAANLGYLTDFVNFLKTLSIGVADMPTLVGGLGHYEYPLGIEVEGPVNVQYGKARIDAGSYFNIADNDLEMSININYANFEHYGRNMDRQAAKDLAFDTNAEQLGSEQTSKFALPDPNPDRDFQTLSPGDPSMLPANCYSLDQYKKKATRYYKSGADFISDLSKSKDSGGLSDGGHPALNGVFYIDGELSLSDLTYKGNGLIVAKTSINISGAIQPADEYSSLGVIARGGSIAFLGQGPYRAAFFSNGAPFCTTDGTVIDGNLVCNGFKRSNFMNTHVFYNPKVTSVTPLASYRKIGKYEAKRYHAEFANSWSEFKFHTE
ncbi:MAG: hypothetical protein GX221_03090 [Candidatus Riflebacteria bacterium]|nr:hypothetical protein [Candidatus Riflebacteria bacterium]